MTSPGQARCVAPRPAVFMQKLGAAARIGPLGILLGLIGPYTHLRKR